MVRATVTYYEQWGETLIKAWNLVHYGRALIACRDALDAERALADRLAAALKRLTDATHWSLDGDDLMPMILSARAALAAHDDARTKEGL